MEFNKETKQKATKILSKIFGVTERTVHKIIDTTGDLSDSLEASIKKGYHYLSEYIHSLTEKDVSSLQEGDLVISPVDIIVTNIISIKAGEVFEFKDYLTRYIKTPLYEPSVKQAQQFGRTQELNSLSQFSDSLIANPLNVTLATLTGYIQTRKFVNGQIPEEEPQKH